MDWMEACQKSKAKTAYRFEIKIRCNTFYVKHFFRYPDGSCVVQTSDNCSTRPAFLYEKEGHLDWVPVEDQPTNEQFIEIIENLTNRKINPQEPEKEIFNG